MKKKLKGHRREIIKGKKYELVVNIGRNPETGNYDRRYRTFYGTAGQADSALIDFVAECENPELADSDLPLSDWLAYWFEKSYKQGKEQATVNRAEIIIKKSINPYLGHIPLSELTPEHIKTHYEILQEKGKITTYGNGDKEKSPLSARSIKYVHTILNMALNEAENRARITANPCRNISPPRSKEKAKEKWILLNAPALIQFLDFCNGHPDYMLITLAAYSGARLSELLGLTKDKLLWKKSSIRIEQTLEYDEKTRTFELKPRTKNDSSTRTVKIEKKIMDLLKEYMKDKEGEYVFQTEDGQPINRHNLYTRFKRLTVRAGYPNMTFHDLRHTHATILLSSGAYIVDVSRRLGHASPTITLNTYAHCLPEGDDVLVSKFSELMGI